MDQFEIKEKLTSKKWFRWTVGGSLVVAVIAAIVAPIVVFTTGGSGDSDSGGIPPIILLPDEEPNNGDKTSFEDSPKAWDAMEVGNSSSSYTWDSDINLVTENSNLIVNTLTPNTLYYGWYSLEDYRIEDEFISFQEYAIPELIASIETNIQNINNIPTLGDYPSMDEFNQWKLDVQEYLVLIDTVPTVVETIERLYTEFQSTPFGSDVGKIGVLYTRSTTELETEGVLYKDKIKTWYEGDHTVTETQIETSPETLPVIYHYSEEVTTAINTFSKEVFSYLFDLVDDLIKRDNFEQIPSLGFTYDEWLVMIDDFDNIISEYGTANVTISNGSSWWPDNSRTNFPSKEEAWKMFPIWTDADASVEKFKWDFNYHKYTEYEYYFEDIFSLIINTLTPNTTYIGWYSVNDYRSEKEFIDFQTNTINTITPLLETGIEMLKGLPLLNDYPTISEFNAWKNDVTSYLGEYSISINEWYTTIKDSFIEFSTSTTFGQDFGVMSVTYLGTATGDWYQRAWFNGGITVTQDQITNSPSTLPNIYRFDNDVLGLMEEYYKIAMDYLFDTFSYVVNEEDYNKLDNTRLTYDQWLIRIENSDYVADNFGMAYIV